MPDPVLSDDQLKAKILDSEASGISKVWATLSEVSLDNYDVIVPLVVSPTDNDMIYAACVISNGSNVDISIEEVSAHRFKNSGNSVVYTKDLRGMVPEQAQDLGRKALSAIDEIAGEMINDALDDRESTQTDLIKKVQNFSNDFYKFGGDSPTVTTERFPEISEIMKEYLSEIKSPELFNKVEGLIDSVERNFALSKGLDSKIADFVKESPDVNDYLKIVIAEKIDYTPEASPSSYAASPLFVN